LSFRVVFKAFIDCISIKTHNIGMIPLAIHTEGLSRAYQSYEKKEGILESLKGFWSRQYVEKVALAPTSLTIPQGQIVGLVGANGAGKTTLLKLLSGLIHPSSGTASVLGYTPWERKNEYLRQMSILLGQKNQLWWDISAKDSYGMLADIYDLDRKKAIDRVDELATMLDCAHVLNTQLRRLSLGERMKMEIIGSLLHEPKVLFLDEPTIGLDIVAQTIIRKFLASYVKEKGPTVILTSHYMDDIAKLADRLLLISKGHIVYDGTVQGFANKAEQKQKISFTLDVTERDLTKTIAEITQNYGAPEWKYEETDFESVIHDFLEKESLKRK